MAIGYEDCRPFLHDHAVITLDDGETVQGRVVLIDHESVGLEMFAGAKQVRFERMTEIKAP